MSDPTRHTSDPNRAALEELADALDLGAGQFSLHLVRCRYRQVQEQLATQLQDICRDSYDLELERITLEASAQNLYTSIQQAVGDRHPQALMVLGIEQVANLDEVLGATENAREEFRKNFHFPLVLWLDDDRYIHFTRQAPNIASWSPGTTDLAIAPDALQATLHQSAEQVSEALLEQTTLPLAPILQQLPRWGMFRPVELPLALEDFQRQELSLEPKAEAMLRLAIAFQQGDIRPPDLEAAQQNFQHSVDFWAQHLVTGTVQPGDNLRAGLAHFFLGRHLEWVCDQQRRRGNDISSDQWTEARRPLEEAIRLFELGDRPDLAAKCLTPFQRVLTRVGDWDTLEAQTQRALELHHIHNDPLKLAYDYGFLSRVHLEREQWAETQQFATQALGLLDNLPPNKAWLQGLYRLHLAEAERALGNPQRAIALLQEAQRWGDRRHPLTYCRILNTLRDLYWEQGRYLEAFKTKQKRLEVEKDAGIRAFVGAGRLGRTVQTIDDLYGVAPEIEASGRKRDLERLLERIGRNDYKLVVIHGSSGVGKSSLVNAGLIPALKQQPIGTKDNLTLVFRQYTSWMEEFWAQLAQELERLKEPLVERPTDEQTQPTLEHILAYFQQRYHNPSEVIRFRSVLIFDQFEEFFFAYPDRLQWRKFFQFLGTCLDIPNVKVVLSLREDYIHYLLEANRSNYMGAIGHDILGRQVLYPLGNLSLTDARATIQDLTRRSRFSLAPDLIDRLVEDLGGSLKEVRPIEMQVVGAQLQTESISTLEAYQALGERPPEVLVERYLEEVYRDCAEHSQLASLVLFLLTDERGTRPLKTRSELEKELATLLPTEAFAEPTSPLSKGELRGDLQGTQSSDDPPKSPLIRGTLTTNAAPTTPLIKGGSRGDLPQPSNPNDPPKSPLSRGTLSATDIAEAEPLAPLDLVLRVICGSGIGVFLPEEPEGRYQLVHDYIAEFVRKKNAPDTAAELAAEREKRIAAESLLTVARGKNKKAQRRLVLASGVLAAALLAVGLAVPVAIVANGQVRDAKENRATAEQERDAAQQERDAAQQERQTAIQERQQAQTEADRLTEENQTAQEQLEGAEQRFILAQQAEAEAQQALEETQILRQQAEAELRDAKQAAQTAEQERILAQEETEIARAGTRLERAGVSALRRFEFQQTEMLIASLRAAVELDQLNQKQGIQTLENYPAASPLLALQSSLDNIRETRIDEGHQERFSQVVFSPDGNRIATRGYDGTARLWGLDGTPMAVLGDQQERISQIVFSPDGNHIATRDDDGTVQIWGLDGTPMAALENQQERVWDVVFSPNGNRIATRDDDGTVRLWELDGTLLAVLEGHQGGVSDVVFSPNGNYIATRGYRTAQLWGLDGTSLAVLGEHQAYLTDVVFSPDSNRIATGDNDGTVRLWGLDGTPLTVLGEHQGSLRDLVFSPNGNHIATRDFYNDTARLWGLDGIQLGDLEGHQGSLSQVVFSPPDSNYIATISDDNTVRLWELNGTQLAILEGHQGEVNQVVFSPDGDYIATGGSDGTLRLWGLDGTQLDVLEGHQGIVLDVVFSPDGNRIATRGYDDTVRLWELDGTQLAVLGDPQESVWEVVFSPDGNRIATDGNDGTVRIWGLD
ncbi:MAG: hypothetical protein AAFX78_14580, partial [Cyanobacteria bacterium J06638_20]